VARSRIRSEREVADRCRELREELSRALERVDEAADDPAIVDAVWRGEALGTLLWALELVALPPYDRPFDAEAVLSVDGAAGTLRPAEELLQERDAARLWHWRARTAELAAAGRLEPPERYAGVDQLVAATAMRGHEQGLLPAPLRGDFGAFGKVYRHLTPPERAEALSIALERHHALAWLCGREGWDDVPLDT
jgi:hypothetical protein